MIFQNGLLAEVEVKNLYDLEEEIQRLHGKDRKITVLNVQHCRYKERGYEAEYYYKVFIMVGETYQQARLREEDRRHLREDNRKYKREYSNPFEQPNSTSFDSSRKQSIPDIKKKLEESKARANNITTSSLDKLNGRR